MTELIRRLLMIILAVPFLLCSCTGGGGRAYAPDSAALDSIPDTVYDMAYEARAWADSVMAEMTDEEKVGQLFMPAVYASDDASNLEVIREWVEDSHIGSVMMLRGNLESAAGIARLMDSLSTVRPLVAIDAEWGLGMRLKDAPVFPANGLIESAVTPETMYEYGLEVARQCRLAGINMVLGPVLDVAPPSGKGIMGDRTFGSDPERVASLGVAYARGLEAGDVMSVAKHFPGHGSPGADSHRTLPVIDRSLEQLRQRDLIPFAAYISNGLSGIMVGHLAVPSIDPRRRPAAVSPVVIQDLLREDMGYDGLILTDALNMEGARGYGAVEALRAGADIIVAPAEVAPEIHVVCEALHDGRLSLHAVEDRCRRVLYYKYLVSVPAPGRLTEINTIHASRIADRLKGLTPDEENYL